MRRFPFRSVVVSLLLVFMLSSVSSVAAQRDGGGDRDRDLPSFVRVIKKIVKNLMAGTLADTLTLPKP